MFAVDVETRIEWVEVLMGMFERHCRRLGHDGDGVHWMGAAVREAVTNGMRHGNRMNPARRLRIEIETEAPGSGNPVVLVAVEDEGAGFDPNQIPDPLQEENLPKESGRGIFFMRHFMDEVIWSRTSRGGTRVVLIQHRVRAGRRGTQTG